MTDPIVFTAWVADRLGGSGLKILDASWWMAPEGRDARAEFEAGHVPGAVFFDIDEVADRTTALPHMLPTPEAFAAAAGALGLSRDIPTVVYDSHGIRSAARVWWTLRVMGFIEVFVMDGGLTAWTAEGRPLETGWPVVTPTSVEPKFDPGLVRSLDQVRNLVTSGAAQIVDARPGARFRGDAPEPRPGLKSGHMPGARSTPFDTVLTADGRLKSAAELEAVFRAARIRLDEPIVTTCGSGVTASVLALALARLGRERTAVYDGSWAEWGSLPDSPVATGP